MQWTRSPSVNGRPTPVIRYWSSRRNFTTIAIWQGADESKSLTRWCSPSVKLKYGNAANHRAFNLINLMDSSVPLFRFQNRRMKWKKDNKLPNTKNVKKKNADGSVQVTPGTGKKGKRGGSKKQQQPSAQSEVKMEMFKDDDFHALLWIFPPFLIRCPLVPVTGELNSWTVDFISLAFSARWIAWKAWLKVV